ncbi:blue copper protein-like [Salvia divinorum]|uniref:Blue copper protein-like n=1 Tax=Salvia divinorum TaxID=28513 RepID=A0ABD1FVB7_SALDI
MKMGRAIALLFVLVISPVAYGQTTHIVGDSTGWDSSVNYVNWARGKTFTVGDSLVFNYDTSHAVDEVRANDYTGCNTANAISSDSNSPTTITLDAPGPRYFLCPRSNHCSQGQKLTVNVVAATTTPSPPSGGGSTPSPPGEDTPPTPRTTTPSSPPPPSGNAATSVGGKMGLAVGSLLVVGAML